MNKIWIAGLVLCGLLAGCTTPEVGTAPETDASSVIDQTILKPSEGTGKVIFKRDMVFMHGYRIPVFVNGKKVAMIGGGEVLTTYLPAGHQIVGVCYGDNGHPASEIGIDVTKSRTTYLHLSLADAGWGCWNISESSY